MLKFCEISLYFSVFQSPGKLCVSTNEVLQFRSCFAAFHIKFFFNVTKLS